MGQVQGNVKILEALDNVPAQAAGIGHDLHTGQDLRPLQGHPPCHNETNVSAAQNDHPLSREPPLHIHIPLGRAGGENSGRTGSRDGNGPPGSLPAAHGKDNGLCLFLPVASGLSHHAHTLVPGHFQDHGIQPDLHSGGADHGNEPSGVFRPGKFFFKMVQAEAVVDALVQNAAQLPVPLHYEDLFQSFFPGGPGSRQSGGAAAHDDQIIHPPSLPSSGTAGSGYHPGPGGFPQG